MTTAERLESIGLVALGLLGMTFWYSYWVAPRDEVRYAIMECMGEESSREAYIECHEQITENK